MAGNHMPMRLRILLKEDERLTSNLQVVCWSKISGSRERPSASQCSAWPQLRFLLWSHWSPPPGQLQMCCAVLSGSSQLQLWCPWTTVQCRTGEHTEEEGRVKCTGVSISHHIKCVMTSWNLHCHSSSKKGFWCVVSQSCTFHPNTSHIASNYFWDKVHFHIVIPIPLATPLSAPWGPLESRTGSQPALVSQLWHKQSDMDHCLLSHSAWVLCFLAKLE